MNILEKTCKEKLLCESCGLKKTSSHIVVSRGDPRARLMLIGEAPGASEDKFGKPFVGRSGQMLDRLFEDVGISTQKDIYICNVVKCRPPNNRRPSKGEIGLSMTWLNQQINLVDPWVIGLAGATAIKTLLGLNGAMSNLRGNWFQWKGRMVMPLFHPAYLLRNPSRSDGSPISLTCRDLLEIRNRIDKLRGNTVMSESESERPIQS